VSPKSWSIIDETVAAGGREGTAGESGGESGNAEVGVRLVDSGSLVDL
jgi:hypothetical protein